MLRNHGDVLMGKELYADIIVDISVESLDKPYQYRIPGKLADRAVAGCAVTIPFGRGNRQIKGYIAGISDKPAIDIKRIKDITDIPEKSISATEQLLALAVIMKQTYGCTMNEAIRTVLPVKKKVKDVNRRTIRLAGDREHVSEVFETLKTKKNAAARVRILGGLLGSVDGTIDYGEALKLFKVTKSTIDSLEREGLISVDSVHVSRDPYIYKKDEQEIVELNDEQRCVVDSFVGEYKKGDRGAYLIHGVTGSGKTEVYLSIMEEVIASGKQVIMLIPEIALTYQTAARFHARFGDRVSIINSRMSAGERYDQYMKAKEGRTDIMIGPRSALFVPFERLGLIILDEEHETSYDSEVTPRYNAREVAMFRAGLAGASVIYGSATPSLDTYYRTTSEYAGQYPVKLYKLSERVCNRSMPKTYVVDMREELKKRNYSMISGKLRGMINDRLAKNEQIILFINRRGYSGFVSCRSCGEAIKCPHCDVSLTVHTTSVVKDAAGSVNNGRDSDKKAGRKLICHYCGYERDMITHCPSCGSKYIGSFGTGTQKIEEMIRKEFPGARVLRMDADTTTGKTGHAEILDSFARHEADILVGTQMIIKGHDFPDVTLVGILAADMALHAGNYKASERCFQSIVQAAGRAGRGDIPGDVVVQTYSPEHYAIVMASDQDYESYYEREMTFRRLMKYPPVSCILTVMAGSFDEENAKKIAEDIGHNTQLYFKNNKKADIIGPAPHEIMKLNDMYRYVVHIKYPDEKELFRLRDIIQEYVEVKYSGKQYFLQVDIC